MTIAELCRREGIAESLHYSWSKEFMETDEARLSGNSKWQASSREVETLPDENEQLKQLMVELILKTRVLQKKCAWFGEVVET